MLLFVPVVEMYVHLVVLLNVVYWLYVLVVPSELSG